MPIHDALNFFDPSKEIPAHHENQLTRAFLVVLRLSPSAHQVWLSLAAPGRKLYTLPQPWSFDTQRWQMLDPTLEVVEPIEGISVLQSADRQDIEGTIETCDRGQALDGIVRYGDELLIVIETKLDGPVATRQAQTLNLHDAQVRFDGAVQSVSWRDLLAAWSGLVQSEMVAGTERMVISDFLDFAECYFPRLGPFTTLTQCRDNQFRIDRRLKAILDEIGGGLTTRNYLECPDRSTLDRVYLEIDEGMQEIRLVVYPADTLTQARAFYSCPEVVSALMALRDGGSGWGIEPNFHFGFMAKGLVWTTSDAPLEDYIAFWSEKIAIAESIDRGKWERFWMELVQRRFARADEKKKFDQHFTSTGRNSATPRPGLRCSYSWQMSEAKRLDDHECFVDAVADKLNIVLRALGENPWTPEVA
jgi:hypothetical protein